MNIGGVQKSLLSLLSILDYEQYEVDLLLLQKGGIFTKYIPEQVNVRVETGLGRRDISVPRMFVKNICNKPKKTLCRLSAGIAFKFNRNYAALLESRAIEIPKKEYDVCIDYGGQQMLYYMVDKIKSKKKISYFHNDYSKWDYYYKTDKKYYKQVDKIITVSPECVKVMKEYFPEYSEKIECIHNITSQTTIDVYSKNENPYMETDKLKFVSIGRVCHDKGNDIAIECAQILKERGLKFQWYVLGPAESEAKEQYYKDMIRTHKVEDEYILLGGTDNPYDHIKYADFVIHPARFEGKPVAIDEAMVLGKVVITTNFSTVHDQMKDRVTGVITDMDASSLAQGILDTIHDKQLQESIYKNLETMAAGNEDELDKFYSIINEK